MTYASDDFDDLTMEERKARRQMELANALVLADLELHCDRHYPEVERENPHDLLRFNWRARQHGLASANVAHFR